MAAGKPKKEAAPAAPLVPLKDADFRKLLKTDVSGGFLFFGEEDYMKTTTLRLARESVCPPDDPMSCFNDIRMDGLDFTASGLLDALTAPPMGADRKIITVTGLNFNTMRAAEQDDLFGVLGDLPQYPYCLVILSVGADALDAGTLPKRPSQILSDLSQLIRPVWFEKNTPQKLYGWVQKHYQHNGVQADPDTCQFTVSFCGRNMFTLASEIDKVSFWVLSHGGTAATADDVRACAIPNMEYDAFAFTNAIMERRRSDALSILRDLKLRRVEPLYILSEVSRVVVGMTTARTLADSGKTTAEISSALRMHEYQVGLYLRAGRDRDPSLLRTAAVAVQEADLSLKRSAADGYQILERLICSL
ncbi:MAG: DNA polymerase III subunit delta [Clostridia bacterium]|nr:DNA polymerase III subunit delta [Clostridia bacterium]